MQIDWIAGVGVIFAAFFAAAGGLLLLAATQSREKQAKGAIFGETGRSTCFIFDNEQLVDATPSARALLANSPINGTAWVRLMACLGPRFPNLEIELARLTEVGRLTVVQPESNDNPLTLQAELRGGLTQVRLLETEQSLETAQGDPFTQRAIQDELIQLRKTLSQAPMMTWREDPQGGVLWANAAYLMETANQLVDGKELSWPLPRLFERTATQQCVNGQRQKIERKGFPDRWFELVSFDEGENRLLFALPADALVQAETSLRDFMQTLTKTFAHLPIGLAIFDKQRQLALFNPALMDLSGLKPDFLSMRPTLFAFLDGMRNRSMIPEPKDYRGWRKQMIDLERAASSGLFEETWSLASGQTYRVIGRPHPNGALALMLEDISSEVSRSRRYRADIELGQGVIDMLDQAIAVFESNGQLVMSNSAYTKLWHHDPSTNLAESTIKILTTHWQESSAPSLIWQDAFDLVCSTGDREPLMGAVRLLDGRMVDCQFVPMVGGATMARFSLAERAVDNSQVSFSTKRLQQFA